MFDDYVKDAKQTGAFILKMNNIGKNLVIIGNNHYLCMQNQQQDEEIFVLIYYFLFVADYWRGADGLSYYACTFYRSEGDAWHVLGATSGSESQYNHPPGFLEV